MAISRNDRRARRAGTVVAVLPRADYYELRARLGDVEALDADALKKAAEYRRKRQAAQAVCLQLFERLAAEYGFDPKGTYSWDDERCALQRVVDEPPAT